MSKKDGILSADDVVTLVGGGYIGPDDLNLTLSRTRFAAAADGGAQAVLDAGRIPDAVIGDFDSLDASTLSAIPQDRLFSIREQNSTDFDKALRNIRAPLVLGVGFLGARVDHQLAVFNSLVRHADRSCVLIGEREVIFLSPPRIEVGLESGDVVSLFPLRPVTGRSNGLEWPIDDLEFEPGGQIGTSNRATGPVSLWIDGPGLLVMLPRAALDQVIQAFLSEQTGRWPVRAG